MTLRLLLIAAVVLTVGLAGAAPAAAHVELDESEPAAGATVRVSPPEIFLRFTGPVADDSVRIRVRDPQGDPVEVDDTESGARAAAAGLPALTRNGRYTVRYDGTAEDGHPFAGRYRFRLRLTQTEPPVAEKPLPTVTASPPAGAGDDQASPATPDEPATGINSALLWAGAVAVAAAVGFGIVLGRLRARR